MTTDSMVTRVARAISPYDTDLLDGTVPGHGPGKCPQCDDSREIIYRRARAAIEAMREPTEAMITFALSNCQDDLEPTGEEIKIFWQAMIEQALKP
jgi:hypothetical protein